ncbi:MAG: MazG-like family protein [Oceanospirillaceae bacterium]
MAEAQSQNLTSAQFPLLVDEIAAVQTYLICLATQLDVNILEAVEQKIVKNAAKYPAG